MKRKLAFVVAAVIASWGGTVSAQVRTFVASYGVDTNPCTLADPCRNFEPAVNAVATGGEVVALDSAGYGPVNITKAVTIAAAPGVHAAIAPTGGAAVVSGSSPVIIRGLYLNGLGASSGFQLFSGFTQLENITARGFSAYGLQSGTGGFVIITNSSFSENLIGVRIFESVGAISGSKLNNNTIGLQTYYNGKASCLDCVISGNQHGAQAEGAYQRYGELVLERCHITNNAVFGVYADAGAANQGGVGSLATIWVSNSTITNNLYGTWPEDTAPGCIGCARVFTRENNTVEGNVDSLFTGPFVPR